jgi:hypothetical protein
MNLKYARENQTAEARSDDSDTWFLHNSNPGGRYK